MSKVVQYQAIVEPVFVPAGAETITMDKWFRQASETQRVPRARAAEYCVEPLNPGSWPVNNLSWFRQASEPMGLSRPKSGEWFVEPIRVAPAEVVTLDKWWRQSVELLRYSRPRADEFCVEPLAPNSFITQRLDWLVEQPGPISYRRPMAESWSVEPLIEIASVILVYGPLIIPAATVYRPGGKEAITYRPGAKAGQVS